MAKTGQAQRRDGSWCKAEALSTLNNLITIRNLQLEYKPERTLDTGLSVGGSCLVFLQTHKDLGAAPRKQHVAIDPYQSGNHYVGEAGLLAVEQADLSGYLDFKEDFSELCLPELLRENARFDLIYIDGFHLFENVLIDFYYSARLLTEGGVILFDDCANPSVRKVIQFIQANCNAIFVELDLRPFRKDQTWRYTVARYAGRQQLTGFRLVDKLKFPRSGLSAFKSF